MSVDKESTLRHEYQNIHLANEHNQRYYERKIFTAHFLHTLAIRERLPSEHERLFIKKTFPVLIHPHSACFKFWKAFVVVLAVVMLLVIPYIFVATKMPLWYLFLKNVITLIYWIDVVVILLTSVEGPHGFCLNFKDNVLAKLRTSYVWFAEIAGFPLEIFTPLLVYNLNHRIIVLMHANRLWKLIRLVRNVINRKKSFKANWMFSWLVILVLTKFYWYYAMYITLNLLNNGQQGPLEVFVLSVFFTTSMSGMGMPNHWIFIISRYVVFAIWLWVLVGICASLILREKNIQDVQEIAFQLLTILKGKRLITYNRLENYLITQYLDNGAFQFFHHQDSDMYISKHFKEDINSSVVIEDLQSAACFPAFEEMVLLALPSFSDLLSSY